MGSEQSVALPQTAGHARHQHVDSQLPQPSFLTRMMDPYANLPPVDSERVSTPSTSSHSRNSSVNGAPGASTSHISLSLDMLGSTTADDNDAERGRRAEAVHERQIVESAMSRIAPPSLASMLAGGESSGEQGNVF
ncbi:unnamed protein product [Agarophyton chilense]